MPGIIRVNEPLKAGGFYKIASVQVVNTGTEGGWYEIGITRVSGQKELEAKPSFFILEPASFYLEPAATQVVNINLKIPFKAQAGDYLTYIEAHLLSTASGGTSIGVAAATKVYYTVLSANFITAIYTRVATFMALNSPWSYLVPALILLGIIILILRKNVKLEVKVQKK